MALLIAALLVAQAPGTQAPLLPPNILWELLGEDAGGKFHLDTASPRREGDLVYFRYHMQIGPEHPDNLHTANALVVIDCARRTSGYVEFEGFDSDGRSVGSRRIRPDEVEPVAIESGTIEEVMHRRVCEVTQGTGEN